MSMGRSVRATSNRDLAQTFPSSPQAGLLESRESYGLSCSTHPTVQSHPCTPVTLLRQPHDHTPPPALSCQRGLRPCQAFPRLKRAHAQAPASLRPEERSSVGQPLPQPQFAAPVERVGTKGRVLAQSLRMRSRKSRKCRSVSGRKIPQLEGSGGSHLPKDPQSWKWESNLACHLQPTRSPQAHPPPSPWSGSQSSHNEVKSRPKRAPTMAPQFQPDVLNLTFGANFNPCPNWLVPTAGMHYPPPDRPLGDRRRALARRSWCQDDSGNAPHVWNPMGTWT